MLIRDVFKEFLKYQKTRLAPKTYKDYESVIQLFEHSLDSYAWNGLDNGDEAYKKAQVKKKTFIDVYDHTHIADNISEFLDYFVPRKVMSGDEFTLKTCPRVIKKLLTWMRDKKLVDMSSEEIKEECENQLWSDTLKDLGIEQYEKEW